MSTDIDDVTKVDGFTTLIKELQGIADTIEAEMVCCDAYAANDSPPAGHEICYWAGASRAVVLARLEVIKKGGA